MPFWKVLQIKGYHHIVCTGTSSVPAIRRSSVSSPKKYLCTPPSAPPPAPHPAAALLHHASRPATSSQPLTHPAPAPHSISSGAASPLCYLIPSTYAHPAPCAPLPAPHPAAAPLHQPPATTAAIRPIHLYRSCISPARSPPIPTIPPTAPHSGTPLSPAHHSTYTRLGPVHPLHKLHNLRCRILADVVHTIETDQKSFFKVDDWSVLQYTVGVKQNDEQSFLINCQPSPAPNARCTPCSSAR